MDRDEMSNCYRWPSVDASYQVSVHLVKRLHRRFSRNRPTRNKNCLWLPCLLTDQDEIRFFFYRWPSIDASYQVSVHLVKRFQRRTASCLLTYRDELRNRYGGPPIDALVHLDNWFQRRRLQYEKFTDDGRQAIPKAHIAFANVTKKRFYWKQQWAVKKVLRCSTVFKIYHNQPLQLFLTCT